MAGTSYASVGCVDAGEPSTARRVLVADDSIAVRDSLTAVLRELGHDVRLAADGTEALEVAERWLPEFGILDVHIPAISGYDVARRLRARFTPAAMQLVMMSGADLDETTLAGAKRAGFDHCIDKTSALKAPRRLAPRRPIVSDAGYGPRGRGRDAFGRALSGPRLAIFAGTIFGTASCGPRRTVARSALDSVRVADSALSHLGGVQVRCCTASRRIVSGILLRLAESAFW